MISSRIKCYVSENFGHGPYRPRQAKKCLRICAKRTDSDHSAHALSIIGAFSLHINILEYPMFLLANSEGSDQTA